jgi:hypothetical protein
MTEQGTDLVEVRGLRLRGRVGVTPDERATEQPLLISVAARLDTRRASAMDDLSETLDYEEDDILDCLKEMTGGRGPDACIDAVGLEGGIVAHQGEALLQHLSHQHPVEGIGLGTECLQHVRHKRLVDHAAPASIRRTRSRSERRRRRTSTGSGCIPACAP